MIKRWGWMLTLLRGKHFKVKLLYFKKHGSISMQMHKKRSELWLWIFGKGELTFLPKALSKALTMVRNVKPGDFFNIPNDCWHHYWAKSPTLVLEIQYGDKCSERDIQRA